MIQALLQFLRSLGIVKPEKSVQPQDQVQEKGLVVVVSDDLMDLFTQVNNCTRLNDHAGRKAALTEILLRYGDDIEITAVPSDRTAIRLRPRAARFSALTMVKLNELDPEVSRIALARMLRRPVNPNAQGKAAKLPKARLVQ